MKGQEASDRGPCY